MRDAELVRFLQEFLPMLGLRWEGYRKVRGQVGKRIARRMRALGVKDLDAYRRLLATDSHERAALWALCLIPISRFYRDRGVWDQLRGSVLPELTAAARDRGDAALACWSAGCASGEEPYTLSLCWSLDVAARFPGLAISILATDADPNLLARARTACYTPGSLEELPPGWRSRGFDVRDELYCLRPELRAGVTLVEADMRQTMPEGPFDLVLCRNAAFTYFDADGQRAFATRLARVLRPGAALVLGRHENLPDQPYGLARPDRKVPIYRMAAP